MVNFSSEKWFTDSGFYPHEINSSCRFESSSSECLTRTPSGTGNRKIFTLAVWVKRTKIANGVIFGVGPSGSNNGAIEVRSNGSLRFKEETSGDDLFKATTALLRDLSAWYHIVVAVDLSQASNSNRVKMYINGTLQTAFDQDETFVDRDSQFNTVSVNNAIGKRPYATTYFDGYLAEMHFIDGTQLTADTFGETKEGVWIPKEVTGVTYGTNGFYMKFDQTGTGTASASTIGADSSGEDNHFTSSGLGADDSNIPDSPTNNFCIINALTDVSDIALAEGNTNITNTTDSWPTVRGTFGATSGKWYYEVANSDQTRWQAGWATGEFINGTTFATTIADSLLAHSEDPLKVYDFGTKRDINGDPSFDTSDILQVAIDIDAGKFWLGINNTWVNNSGGSAGNPASGTNELETFTAGTTMYPSFLANGANLTVNFGQDSSFAGAKTAQNNSDQNGRGDFYYTPPAGYLALCTANLPEPTISPLNGKQPSDYFNTVLYTGDDSTNAITGVGFQPDLVWLKNRDYAVNHRLYNALTYGGPYSAGASGSKYLKPNANTGDTAGTANSLISLDSDGFTVHGSGGETNDLNEKYVAWNWLAGNGTTTNDASATGVGSTDSVYSVNTTAGFSIVTYTGTGSATTIAHGLGVKPNTIWIKRRTVADYGNWSIYVDSPNMGAGKSIYFDLDNAAGTSSSMMNDTEPTSSVFTVNTSSGTNTNTHEYIAFCFSNVEGYSKFGEFAGNGDASGDFDGPFVFTGFRPAWLMWKRTNDTNQWVMNDAKRNPNNPNNQVLYANLTDADSTGEGIVTDFVSNGFKLRTGTNGNANTNNSTYIYMAFAEMPFKYANGR